MRSPSSPHPSAPTVPPVACAPAHGSLHTERSASASPYSSPSPPPPPGRAVSASPRAPPLQPPPPPPPAPLGPPAHAGPDPSGLAASSGWFSSLFLSSLFL